MGTRIGPLGLLRISRKLIVVTSSSGFETIADYGDGRLYTPTVPGTAVRPLGGVLRGDVGTVLVEVMRQWHVSVEPLLQSGGCWGFQPRNIAGTSTPSNHASGTAVDIMAALHPRLARTLGRPEQGSGLTAALAILSRVNGLSAGRDVIAWGGTWSAAWLDEMHWEIAPHVDRADLAHVAAAIRAGVFAPKSDHAPPAVALPAAGLPWIGYGGVESGPLVARVQRRLAARGYRVGAIDGVVGPLFDAAVRLCKSRAPRSLELSADGRVGPDTWRYMRP